ncbi:MAG TPA: M20/M25/M40 family metallo-hydrolase [candidate division Zixibacteria bacterium]|nr:M20/M25/M40 family metallo-hydrolase [candidate division Zixibacteria bacterium]
MDLFALTRQLVDIESITGHEGPVAHFLAGVLEREGFVVERMPVEGERINLFACEKDHPQPPLVFSTHLDVVPPWFSSSEDDQKIYGRGSCDAKGIIAAQVAASLELRKQGVHTGLLFVCGEERDSLGATVANQNARGSRFLVNGEPTDNRIAVASKGALRVEITAHGKLAHSAYPELGESAIDKLLDALQAVRSIKLPVNAEVGACTMNIGIIEGGRATNVISDFSKAQLLFRLVAPATDLREQIVEAVGNRAEVAFVLEIPSQRFRTVPGIETMTAAFTTDIPKLSNWGEPVLLGPGSIHVAHTEHEFVSKQELKDAVELYVKVAKHLLAS